MCRFFTCAKLTPPFQLTLVTNEASWADAAEIAGVDQIGIDIERMGKAQRQRNVQDARVSNHELSDLALLKGHARNARLFVRLNPPHSHTKGELEAAQALGATSVMLPYFHRASQAQQFANWVAGRAHVALLVETRSALEELPAMVRIEGVDEIMLGLNDLHIELGYAHPTAVAASDVAQRASEMVRSAGLIFGMGGLARPSDKSLAIDPDLVIARCAQLGVGSSWVSRSFLQGILPSEFASEVRQLRCRLAYWFSRPAYELLASHQSLMDQVERYSKRAL
jgi:hypothetical protein